MDIDILVVAVMILKNMILRYCVPGVYRCVLQWRWRSVAEAAVVIVVEALSFSLPFVFLSVFSVVFDDMTTLESAFRPSICLILWVVGPEQGRTIKETHEHGEYCWLSSRYRKSYSLHETHKEVVIRWQWQYSFEIWYQNIVWILDDELPTNECSNTMTVCRNFNSPLESLFSL